VCHLWTLWLFPGRSASASLQPPILLVLIPDLTLLLFEGNRFVNIVREQTVIFSKHHGAHRCSYHWSRYALTHSAIVPPVVIALSSSAHNTGTGWSGLTLAKTYTQAHPDVDLAVLEAADSVGGVWASHRLYPGLRTNSILGSYENPDFPMTMEKFGVKPGEHIPGAVVHQYVTDFAKAFGIWHRIRFQTKVEQIQQSSNGEWILTLTVSQSYNGKESMMERKQIAVGKLVIATGVTGNPNMLDIPGEDTFDAPLFHAKEFLQKKEILKTAKNVVVYGGSKSAVRLCRLLDVFFFNSPVHITSLEDYFINTSEC
jgi:Pyridine nucleotide-disulphide oxidoreductase